MQHNGLMDAFYGFQPIIIMDLLTKVLCVLYTSFMFSKKPTKTKQNQKKHKKPRDHAGEELVIIQKGPTLCGLCFLPPQAPISCPEALCLNY